MDSTFNTNGKDGKSINILEEMEYYLRDLMFKNADNLSQLSLNEKNHQEEIKKILIKIIEAIDAFERVFRVINAKKDLVTPQMNIWIGNFRTIYKLLNKIITEKGVLQIENLSQGFDPHWHKISETIEDKSRPDGTISEEILKGYIWHNQILRETEVIVVRNSIESIAVEDET